MSQMRSFSKLVSRTSWAKLNERFDPSWVYFLEDVLDITLGDFLDMPLRLKRKIVRAYSFEGMHFGYIRSDVVVGLHNLGFATPARWLNNPTKTVIVAELRLLKDEIYRQLQIWANPS